jgi:regulator of protease activity HflC (stomatin/prohibitin superfamily)
MLKLKTYNYRRIWDDDDQAEAERSRRARILALAEEQAAGKLLEAGKLIDQSPSAIKLRLYQTLANIATEKNSTILFPFQKRFA